MARKKQGGGRTTPKKQQPTAPAFDDPFERAVGAAIDSGEAELDEGDLELFRSIRMSIDANPIELLGLASSFVDSNDPRTESIFDATPDDADPVMAQLLDLAGLEARETDALAIAVASLLPQPDALPTVRERIGASEWLPTWLRKIDEATVENAFELVDVLGDADQLTFEVRFPGNKTFSLVILIDNNQGVVVTDGFAVPLGLEELAAVVDQGDTGMTRRPLDLAVARARLEEAIELGFNTVPPYETDTWPDIRPLTEWMMRLLPEGGVAPMHEPLTRAASQEVTERFAASPFAADLNAEQLGLVEHLLWFKGGSGTYDPLRWSTVSVEMFLVDWVPQKLDLSDDQLADLQTVLEAFVSFAHAELGNVPTVDTDETLEAVRSWNPAAADS